MRVPATVMISALLVVVGVALIVRTLAAGGGAGSIGLLFGILILLAGSARLYAQRRNR